MPGNKASQCSIESWKKKDVFLDLPQADKNWGTLMKISLVCTRVLTLAVQVMFAVHCALVNVL